MYKKILIAADGSVHAINAVKQAVELQKIMNSKVVIIHSIKDDRTASELYPNVDVLFSKYGTLKEVYKEAGMILLDETRKTFGVEQKAVETRLIEDESAGDYICRIAEEENFDLIILGSRGKHSKIKKAFLGTVSTKVAKNAPCDVLIVK